LLLTHDAWDRGLTALGHAEAARIRMRIYELSIRIADNEDEARRFAGEAMKRVEAATLRDGAEPNDRAGGSSGVSSPG